MEVRGKIAEFLSDVQYLGGLEGKIADYLIAHGVTVQEWIPVTERLPEPGDYVLVCDTREAWYGLWEFSGSAWYDASYQPWSIDEVTHWQYLPQPPKGE